MTNSKCKQLLLICLLALLVGCRREDTTTTQTNLYEVINDDSYKAIKFLGQFPQTTVLAPVHTSTAIYPISGHNIVATLYFYGDRKEVDKAYASGDCSKIYNLATKYNATFIMNDIPMDCNFEQIYDDGYYIYKI